MENGNDLQYHISVKDWIISDPENGAKCFEELHYGDLVSLISLLGQIR